MNQIRTTQVIRTKNTFLNLYSKNNIFWKNAQVKTAPLKSAGTKEWVYTLGQKFTLFHLYVHQIFSADNTMYIHFNFVFVFWSLKKEENTLKSRLL